jgi:hypothetical protein
MKNIVIILFLLILTLEGQAQVEEIFTVSRDGKVYKTIIEVSR